ncbi:MAG: DNA repair protein RecO [Pirellulales bacterium]|nr:DNA repair protein RecO [Pirellulales bacterium]
MESQKAIGIVLRTVEFSETSLVVTIFTREYGKIGAIAKGARRIKGPFESALDLLAVCRIVFLRKSFETLDILTEAKLVRRFKPAGRDLSGLYAGYYVIELLDGLTEQYSPQADLFDLAEETLEGLSDGEPVQRWILRFELGALRILGHLPLLHACVECGCEVPIKGRVAFGHLDGGVLCMSCRKGKQHVASVDAGTLRVMDQLAQPESKLWQRLEIRPTAQGQIRGLMNRYISHLMGRKPKMQGWLKG